MNDMSFPQPDSLRWPASARVSMSIMGGAEYLPEQIADNAHFSRLTGRPEAWFERATGIATRRRAAPHENSNTMAISAVERMLAEGESLDGIDLIIGASYTPWDTVGTMAHAVQRHFEIRGAKALYVSTACSSFINALEIAAAFFDSGRARRALIVLAEHNSLYADDSDEQSGHLWGDAATALILDTSQTAQSGALQVVDIDSRGLGDLGAGPGGVYLHPRTDGLVMPLGKDVFQHACREIESAARAMLERHLLTVDDIRLLVPHQANDRIISHVAERLGTADGQIARSIGYLGNTGCASTALTLFRHRDVLRPGDLALLVTFGGGYSMGCALLRCQ